MYACVLLTLSKWTAWFLSAHIFVLSVQNECVCVVFLLLVGGQICEDDTPNVLREILWVIESKRSIVYIIDCVQCLLCCCLYGIHFIHRERAQNIFWRKRERENTNKSNLLPVDVSLNFPLVLVCVCVLFTWAVVLSRVYIEITIDQKKSTHSGKQCNILYRSNRQKHGKISG